MTMTITMTHSGKVNQRQSATWPHRREWRGHNSAKKNLVTLLCLALLARCALRHCWRQCVITSIGRKKEQRVHCLLLQQIRLNSDFGCHGIPRNLYNTSTVKPWSIGRKNVAGSWAHQSDLVDVDHLFEVQGHRFPRLLRIRHQLSYLVKFCFTMTIACTWQFITKFGIFNPSRSSGSLVLTGALSRAKLLLH